MADLDEASTGDSKTFITTGIPGLDEILLGGLTPNRLYLVEGSPGTGKSYRECRFPTAQFRS